MAPNGEILGNHHFLRSNNITIKPPKPQSLPSEALQRAISDLSFELSRSPIDIEQITNDLPPISEVEDAKCECCGMCEEFTPEYITKVREKFFGKWICGLCSEAVKEEAEKNGGKKKEALDKHISVCVRFNRFGRTKPVLYQAEAMREMLRKSTRGVRAKSTSPRDKMSGKRGGIARSSSCIPTISKEINELAMKGRV